MNERLKELDKQAVDYALSVCDANGVYQGKEYLSVVKERFAELIVAECMEVFSKDLPEPGDGKMLEVINRVCNVAEHFGVEK